MTSSSPIDPSNMLSVYRIVANYPEKSSDGPFGAGKMPANKKLTKDEQKAVLQIQPFAGKIVRNVSSYQDIHGASAWRKRFFLEGNRTCRIDDQFQENNVNGRKHQRPVAYQKHQCRISDARRRRVVANGQEQD